MFEIIVIIALIGYLAYREYIHHKEIIDLTTKLSFRDAEEAAFYARTTGAKPRNDGDNKIFEQNIQPMDEADPSKVLDALQKEQQEADISED